jgi:hypothetical protein
MLVNLIYLVLLVNQFQLLLPRKKRTSDNRNRKNGEWGKRWECRTSLKVASGLLSFSSATLFSVVSGFSSDIFASFFPHVVGSRKLITAAPASSRGKPLKTHSFSHRVQISRLWSTLFFRFDRSPCSTPFPLITLVTLHNTTKQQCLQNSEILIFIAKFRKI